MSKSKVINGGKILFNSAIEGSQNKVMIKADLLSIDNMMENLNFKNKRNMVLEYQLEMHSIEEYEKFNEIELNRFEDCNVNVLMPYSLFIASNHLILLDEFLIKEISSNHGNIIFKMFKLPNIKQNIKNNNNKIYEKFLNINTHLWNPVYSINNDLIQFTQHISEDLKRDTKFKQEILNEANTLVNMIDRI